uniref:Uncharacterized protein n=1 Tax=Glossina austeni TaxID=7395 RepID=A0A1A9VC30_GLOAU
MLLMLLSARVNKRSISVSMRIIGKDVSTSLRAFMHSDEANMHPKHLMKLCPQSMPSCIIHLVI